MTDPVTIGDATLYCGDCVAVMAELPANSVAAIVCDPPYLLNFMSKAFDSQHKALPGANEGQKMQAWHARWVAEAFRILKPGGHLAAFGGDRTHHRLLAAMEDAGFELRQNVYWAFGSGFPKSQDAGKALDRKAGAVREVVGVRILTGNARRPGRLAHPNIENAEYTHDGKVPITAPATPAAQRWHGWGTALKPAVEIVCVGRKPMRGTLADNLLAWGCGALNVDGCRVGTDDLLLCHHNTAPQSSNLLPSAGYDGNGRQYRDGGRFPAHLLHDGSPEVVAMFPVTTTNSTGSHHTGEYKSVGITGWKSAGAKYGGDTGSAARFFQSCPYDAGDFDPLFYSGKAAKKDRDEGCGGLEERRVDSDFRQGGAANPRIEGRYNHARNHHVSVKPTALMRWLVRLFTPPGETVLDPFLGSGSTLKAALLENKTCIGIEMDPEYFAIAVERIRHVSPEAFALEAIA